MKKEKTYTISRNGILSVFIVLMMAAFCIFISSQTVNAADIVAAGDCGAEGNNATWVLDSEGTLTISGSGAIAGYTGAQYSKVPWYDYTGDIKAVIIEEGITEIGLNDFSGLASLTTVSLPNTLTAIGSNAFNSSTLTEIVIPEGVTTIGEWAFFMCEKMERIVIPNSVKTIEQHAFHLCSGAKVIQIGDNLESLGNGAFSNCRSVKSIILPDSLTSIGYEAFYDCEALESVKLPKSIETIPQSMFGMCKSLERIDLPDTVTSIENSAFNSCTLLSDISLSNIDSVGEHAFAYCYSLKNIDLQNTVSLGGYAFSECNNLINVKLSQNLDSIGDSSFENCTSLADITLPQNINNIGTNAFRNCSSLKTIAIPSGLARINDGTFCECKSLSKVVIPEGVASIGNSAFSNCTELYSVTLPESLKTIDANAFNSDRYIESITFPQGLESIGYAAFSNCGLKSLDLPETLTLIDGYSFASNYITSITIPGSVESIGSYSFAFNLLTNIKIEEGVKTVCANAFHNNWKNNYGDTVYIELPDSLETIEANAFGTDYIDISIGKNLKNCDLTAFGAQNDDSHSNYSNNMLKFSVSSENGYYESFGDVLFNKGRDNLLMYPSKKSDEEYVAPNSTKIITELKGENLTKVVLPETIESIGKNSIYLKPGAHVYIEARTAPDIYASSFLNEPEEITIHVPSDAVGYNEGPWAKLNVVYGIPIESVSLSQASIEFTDSTPVQLTASYLPENATDDTTAIWTSSNEEVATVDSNGFVTPTGVGNATITVSISGKTATCDVTVLDEAVKTYVAEIQNGTGSGSYAPGQTVIIKENGSDKYKEFSKWEVVSGNVTLKSVNDSETSFVMPASDVVIMATYTPTELGQAVNDKNDAVSAKEQAEADLAAKTEELNAAKEAEAQAKSDAEAAAEAEKQAKAEAQAAKEAEAEAQAAAEAANQKVDELTQAKTDLEKQLAESQASEASTEESLKETQAELEKVRAELDTAKQEKSDAEAAASAATEEKNRAEAALETAQSEKQQAIEAKDAAVQEKEAAEARAKAAEEEVERLKALVGGTNIKSAVISGVSDTAYTGSPVEPEITVTMGDTNLIEGTDYSVYFVNNIGVGTATVIVTGEGNYDGACKKTFNIVKADLGKAAIKGLTAKTYTGKAILPGFTVAVGDRTLVKDTDYKVAYANNTNAGTAKVTLTGIGNYEGTYSATFAINKANNTLTASGKTATLKYKTLKKKAQTLTAAKSFTVSKAQGAVTYKKVSGNAKITVSSKGVLSIKKGLKKGTYKVKVNVTAAGNANIKALTRAVTLTIKVK